MRMDKRTTARIFRWLFLAGSVAFFLFFSRFISEHAICPIGGFEMFFNGLFSTGFSLAGLFSGMVLTFFFTSVLLILFRRAYCGYLCPVGAVQELSERFDLAVLDLMLPGLDGIEVARRIRAAGDLPIVMLTARDSEADKLLGLEVGADDYLTKPFSVRELGARIRAVLRRSGGRSADSAAAAVSLRGVELDAAKRTVVKAGRGIDLTSAQFDLLRILLSAPGRVFTRGELIQTLSGYEYEGYERTIDVHVKNLRKALEGDPSEPTLIQTVWGVGYKVAE